MEANWVIEATRKCLLKCEHCFRGNAQDKMMNRHNFRWICNNLEINNLTLSGGEPLLNQEVLREVIQQKGLNSLYIATSGFFKRNPDESDYVELFDILTMIKSSLGGELYLDMSTDIYHKKNYEFKDYADMYCIELGFKDNMKYNEAIGMGRAYKNHIGFKNAAEYLPAINEEQEDYPTLLITVDGDVYPGCDWSYKALRKWKSKLCLGNALTDTKEIIEANYKKLIRNRKSELIYNEENYTIKEYI